MTREELQHCDAELSLLVPAEWACSLAREHARSFNQDVADVRAALLEPARDLFERGAPLRELPACLEKAVAELAFWRRVLLEVHGAAFGPEPARSSYLLRYLTS
jgi:hypothetical protein